MVGCKRVVPAQRRMIRTTPRSLRSRAPAVYISRLRRRGAARRGAMWRFRFASLVLDLENTAAVAEFGAYPAQEGREPGAPIGSRLGGAGQREASARRPASGAGDAQRTAQRAKLDVDPAAGAPQPRHMRAELQV